MTELIKPCKVSGGGMGNMARRFIAFVALYITLVVMFIVWPIDMFADETASSGVDLPKLLIYVLIWVVIFFVLWYILTRNCGG